MTLLSLGAPVLAVGVDGFLGGLAVRNGAAWFHRGVLVQGERGTKIA